MKNTPEFKVYRRRGIQMVKFEYKGKTYDVLVETVDDLLVKLGLGAFLLLLFLAILTSIAND